MEKESYQPSAEEMEKAQEMANAVQNERGEEMMSWEQKSRSNSREESIEKEEEEKLNREQRRTEEEKAIRNEGPHVMTDRQKNASEVRKDIISEEKILHEKGLGELVNVKLKEFEVNKEDEVDYYKDQRDNHIIRITASFEGDVEGHKLEIEGFGEVYKRKQGGQSEEYSPYGDLGITEARIDGIPLGEEERRLLRRKGENFLLAQIAEHMYVERSENEMEKFKQKEEWLRKAKEEEENKQKASEIFKSIFNKEKQEE